MPIDIKTRGKIDDVTAMIVQWIEDIEQSREQTDRIALELYKNYRSIRGKKFYNGDADIFVPFSFMIVETMVARMMKAIFNEPVPVPIVGIGPKDKDRADKIRALLHMQQRKQVKLWIKLQDYIRAKCIFPRAYAQMVWRTDYRKIKRPKTPNEDPTEGSIEEGGLTKPEFPTIRSEEIIVADYDCWDFTNLDYFDVGVDPMAPDGDIQRAGFTYIRSLITDNELKILADQKDEDGVHLYQKIKKAEGLGEGEYLDEIIDKKELSNIQVRNLTSLKNNGQRHEMHVCYMPFSMDDDDFVDKNCLFVILDRKLIIRAEKNPFWHGKKPLISGSFFRVPNEFMGMSLIQPVRKIQYEINDKRNQELDYTTMALMPMWIIGDDAEIEDSQIRATQNGALRVGDITQIRQMTMPDITGQGQRAEAILESNMRETTGVTRAVAGIPGAGSSQTATQATQLLAQAGERIAMMLETFGQEEWPQIWEFAHELNRQFLRQPTFVRLTEKESFGFKFFGTVIESVPNEDGSIDGEVDEETGEAVPRTIPEETVEMEDVQMDVDFYFQGFQEVESENIRNNNIVQFMQLVGQMPPSEDNATFWNMLIDKFWTKVLKFNREELVDDQGRRLLLTPPGAMSAFDVQPQPAEGGTAPENRSPEEGGNQGSLGAGPGASDADILSQLESVIPTGGPQ